MQNTQPRKKEYTLAPRKWVWGFLATMTGAIAFLMICGLPISPWWLFIPLGVPIGLTIAVPLAFIAALLVLGLAIIAILLTLVIPFAILCLLFYPREKSLVDDLSDYDNYDEF